MSLPYENATTGRRALDDIQKTLASFGCAKFGHMTDAERGEVLVQFEYRSRHVSVRASVGGYAAAWLKRNPYTGRSYRGKRPTRDAHERKAREIASVAVYSILRDWVKGQITAIETGVLSFEGAFLGQILLPSGRTVLETVSDQKMLPALAEKVVQIGVKP